MLSNEDKSVLKGIAQRLLGKHVVTSNETLFELLHDTYYWPAGDRPKRSVVLIGEQLYEQSTFHTIIQVTKAMFTVGVELGASTGKTWIVSASGGYNIKEMKEMSVDLMPESLAAAGFSQDFIDKYIGFYYKDPRD